MESVESLILRLIWIIQFTNHWRVKHLPGKSMSKTEQFAGEINWILIQTPFTWNPSLYLKQLLSSLMGVVDFYLSFHFNFHK